MDFSKYRVYENWMDSEDKEFYILDRRKIKKLKRKYHLIPCSNKFRYFSKNYYVLSPFTVGKGIVLIQKRINNYFYLSSILFDKYEHRPNFAWFLKHKTPAYEFYVSEKQYLIDKLKN